MKIFADAAVSALALGDVMVGGAVEILADPVTRFFSGFGQLTIDGETFYGIGSPALVAQSTAAIGGTAQGVSLTLSGVDSDIVALINYASAKNAICTLYRMMINSAGTVLLDAQVFARGKLDTLEIEETPGGASNINVMVETAARALGRRGGRMRTDSDQRLISANDACFKAVSYAGEKTLYWGGPMPGGGGQFNGTVRRLLGTG